MFTFFCPSNDWLFASYSVTHFSTIRERAFGALDYALIGCSIEVVFGGKALFGLDLQPNNVQTRCRRVIKSSYYQTVSEHPNPEESATKLLWSSMPSW